MDVTVTVSLDARPAIAVLQEIASLKRTPEVLQLALDILDRPFEFLCFKSCPAAGTAVSTLLEPADCLLDRLAAVRAVQL